MVCRRWFDILSIHVKLYKNAVFVFSLPSIFSMNRRAQTLSSYQEAVPDPRTKQSCTGCVSFEFSAAPQHKANGSRTLFRNPSFHRKYSTAPLVGPS